MTRIIKFYYQFDPYHAEKKETVVSLIPITDCIKVTTENFEYPLNRQDMYVDKRFGVSTIMTVQTMYVSVEAGTLLVMLLTIVNIFR